MTQIDEKSIETAIQLRDNIGLLLQELENLLGQNEPLRDYWLNERSMRIRFPRGFIRRVKEFENRIPFVQDPTLRKNIAYTFQFTDIIRWFINRFDIGLTLFDMLIKVGIVTLASIAEAMCYGFLKWYVQKIKRIDMPRKFDGMINLLAKSEKVIDMALFEDLHWLREKRNNIHLWRAYREYQAYDLGDYNKAVKTIQRLEVILNEFWENHRLPF